MKARWPTKPLGEILTFLTSGSRGWARYYRNTGDLFLRIQNVGKNKMLLDDVAYVEPPNTQEASRTLVESGDVLLSITADLGRTAVVPPGIGKAFINQHLAILRVRNIDPHFLSAFIASPEGQKQVMGRNRQAVKAGLNFDDIRSFQIPLPPLAEQKRIAGILDAADALRAKRRESLAQLDSLLQSSFLDLFGDPVSNPMGWPVKLLNSGVKSFEGGRNLMPTEDERSDGIRVLKVSAVTSGEYRPEESKSIAEEVDVPLHHIVKTGDLLISRANTAALVGAVSYVWETPGREMLPDKLWRFVWRKPQRIEPLFMLHIARSAYFREQLIQRATGTSGSMKNIGKAKMLEIPIPLPPLPLQRRFASIVESVERQKERQRAHLAELDALFAALQHRAFRGEL